MNFDTMDITTVEQRGRIVAARLREAVLTRSEAITDATAFLMRAQDLPDIGQPQIYFDVLKLLKDATA